MTALTLYLLRHGEPDLLGGFYGHADVGLSARGQAQAQAQADALAGRALAGVYCSDLARAAIGARLVAGPSGPAPVELAALREMHLGVLERVGFAEARARHPELAGRSYEDMLEFRMPEGGESVQDVAARAVPCVEGIVAAHARAGSAKEDAPVVVIVAHNTVLRVVLACAAGLGPAGYVRFEQAFGAISRVEFGDAWAGDVWRAARIAASNWVPGRMRP